MNEDRLKRLTCRQTVQQRLRGTDKWKEKWMAEKETWSCQRWISHRRKKQLPHTRDPEFATPKSQEKKTSIQTNTKETMKKKGGKNREKTVKQKQRCKKASYKRWSHEMQSRSRGRSQWKLAHARSLNCHEIIRLLLWLRFSLLVGKSLNPLTISCCSCICAIFLVYFWSTCFSSPTTPSQRSLRAFLSLISWRKKEKTKFISQRNKQEKVWCSRDQTVNEYPPDQWMWGVSGWSIHIVPSGAGSSCSAPSQSPSHVWASAPSAGPDGQCRR